MLIEKLKHSRLLEVLIYNPNDGLFKWKERVSLCIKIGDVAGCFDKCRGYIKLRIDGVTYSGHRLAWFYMTGKWPEKLIDHKDGVRDNNKWNNLREATASQNNYNRAISRLSQTGAKGVNKGRNGRFRVYICLGTYDTKEEAAMVYARAATKLHGEFVHKSVSVKA